jgi:hypothetical protein
LQYGHVLTSSWQGKDRSERLPDAREPLPLSAGVSCFAIAETTSSEASALKDALIGDGLVPLRSALGQYDEAPHSLKFDAQNQLMAHSMNPMDLLSRTEVAAQVLTWLAT